jgi:hypothetical protein
MPATPTSRIRSAAAAAVGIGIVAAAIAAPLQPAMRATAWSAVMLASFVGWGSIANLWLAPRRWMDWGLRAGWGMALVLLTGGFLCGVHLAVRPVLVTQVGLGVVALLVTSVLRRPSLHSWAGVRRHAVLIVDRFGVHVLVLGAYALALLTFFSFLGFHTFQPSDDPPFYFMLAEKLVQTGSMFEPFAVRRVSLFGAQVYLHASFISIASIYYLHVVDAGLSFIIALALIVGHVSRSGLKAWHAVPVGLAMLLLFSLQDVRVNTNSEVSGLVAVLTLYRTVRIPFGSEPDGPRWPMEPRRLVALAGLALVSILLRISNAPAVLLFMGFVLGSDYVLGTHQPWTSASLRALLRSVGIFAGTFLFALLPWAILQKQSSGTFFYPFGHSNVTPGWTFLEVPKDWGEEGSQLVTHLFYGKPVVLFLPFAIAGLAPLAGRARNDLAALSLASLLGLVVFAHKAAALGPQNTSRYCFAFVTATSLMAAVSVGRSGARAAIVAAALALHLASSREETRGMLDGYVANAYGALHETGKERKAFDDLTADYVDVQSHVPRAATMATAVFEGFRFDFKRNPIYALDVLGGMGPKPGWPAHKGAAALDAYLRSNGIEYLVWVDFSLPSEFYNRAHWTSHLSKVGSHLQGEAVLQLDAEDAIEKISAMHRVVYRANGMNVVDLGAPAVEVKGAGT